MIDDRHLDRLLGSLPRAKARDGFTREVLNRLDRPVASPRRPWRPALAAAAVVVAVTAAVVAVRHAPAPDADVDADRALLEQLQADYDSLSRDIDSLRSAVDEGPAVYLGGDDQVAVVLDLDSLPRQARGLEATPATHPRARSREALDF